MSESARIITTSWDDGDARDLRIAEMLVETGLRGTFYVPVQPFGDRPTLTANDMREMGSAHMEIGAHGIDHEIFSELSASETMRVVVECKRVLENKLGVEVPMFCYPRGRYTAETIRCLRQAGFRGARTTRMISTSLGFSAFEMPTSCQAYPHTRLRYLRNLARGRSLHAMYDWFVDLQQESNWVRLAKRMLNRVLQKGGVWHLYGHSWEIDDLGLWDELKELLDYASATKALCLTNGELLNYVTTGTALTPAISPPLTKFIG